MKFGYSLKLVRPNWLRDHWSLSQILLLQPMPFRYPQLLNQLLDWLIELCSNIAAFPSFLLQSNFLSQLHTSSLFAAEWASQNRYIHPSGLLPIEHSQCCRTASLVAHWAHRRQHANVSPQLDIHSTLCKAYPLKVPIQRCQSGEYRIVDVLCGSCGTTWRRGRLNQSAKTGKRKWSSMRNSWIANSDYSGSNAHCCKPSEASPGTKLPAAPKMPSVGPRPIIKMTRATCFASKPTCFTDPCFLTWSWYSSSPIATVPDSLDILISCSKKRSLFPPKGFVPKSLRFHVAPTWANWTEPSATACWIHKIRPATCFNFPGPNLKAICLAEEESTSK